MRAAQVEPHWYRTCADLIWMSDKKCCNIAQKWHVIMSLGGKLKNGVRSTFIPDGKCFWLKIVKDLSISKGFRPIDWSKQPIREQAATIRTIANQHRLGLRKVAGNSEVVPAQFSIIFNCLHPNQPHFKIGHISLITLPIGLKSDMRVHWHYPKPNKDQKIGLYNLYF